MIFIFTDISIIANKSGFKVSLLRKGYKFQNSSWDPTFVIEI